MAEKLREAEGHVVHEAPEPLDEGAAGELIEGRSAGGR